MKTALVFGLGLAVSLSLTSFRADAAPDKAEEIVITALKDGCRNNHCSRISEPQFYFTALYSFDYHTGQERSSEGEFLTTEFAAEVEIQQDPSLTQVEKDQAIDLLRTYAMEGADLFEKWLETVNEQQNNNNNRQ
jgi:hypothetical protein